jgi:hypothetical protein
MTDNPWEFAIVLVLSSSVFFGMLHIFGRFLS